MEQNKKQGAGKGRKFNKQAALTVLTWLEEEGSRSWAGKGAWTDRNSPGRKG